MAVAKLITAAGTSGARKMASALVKRAAKRKAERLAKANAKKAADRAASRAATRAKEIKAAQDKAGRAKRNRSKVTSSKPKTKGKTTKPSKPTQGASGADAFNAGYSAGKSHYTRKLAKPYAVGKKILGNRFVQTGAAGYGGAKIGGGSSSNTVSNKSSYTQADYDEARRRIYGR
jgi:hypothetical protein